MGRVTMNSVSLQKHFSNIYSDFFGRNDVVVSGSYSFPWSFEGGPHRSENINIRSKIPLKCFVGIKKSKTKNIIFKDIISYDILNNNFDTFPYVTIIKEESKIIEKISKFLEENNLEFGLEIEIISETTRGHGFGFSGTHFALISTILELIVNKETSIDNLDKEKVLNLAWELDYVSRYGNSIGEVSYHTLSDKVGPSYIFSERFNINNNPDLTKISREFNVISEKFKDSIITDELYLDYGMIFSGICTDTKTVEQFKKAENVDNQNYEKFIRNEILGDNDENISFNRFGNENSIHNHLMESISIYSLKTIYLIKKVLETGNNELDIENLINHYNIFRNIISSIEKQNSFTEDLIYAFRKNIKNHSEKIGIMPVYSGKLGGGYIFMLKKGISRNTITKAIKDLKNSYPGACIEFASYIDGESNEGVKVEQNITMGIFSKYVQKNKLQYVNNFEQSYLGDYNEIIEKENKGILLDTINNKIFINGEKLTSKDIPSQNTTIELLVKLLENIGEEISNKQIPVSSYSKSKNEMVGKIIIPIIKVVEDKLGVSFPIVCKGSLSEFYIKLDPTDIRLGIVKKIGL